MTSSSSPGVSLKQEGISYLAGAQLPAVIANIMRGGPGLGNIAPAQGDYFQATRGGGHGDYHTIVLAPYSVQEMADLTRLAFELADKYRNPVIVLADAILGQMMEGVQFKKAAARKNVKKDWAVSGARGRSPNLIRSLYLEEGVLEEHNKELQKKYLRMTRQEIRYELINGQNAEIILIAYGSMARILRDVVRRLAEEGIRAALLRPITLWPFPYEAVEELTDKVKFAFVVELSEGQMLEDVKLAVGKKIPVHFYGRLGGGVPSPLEVVDKVKERIK